MGFRATSGSVPLWVGASGLGVPLWGLGVLTWGGGFEGVSGRLRCFGGGFGGFGVCGAASVSGLLAYRFGPVQGQTHLEHRHRQHRPCTGPVLGLSVHGASLCVSTYRHSHRHSTCTRAYTYTHYAGVSE